MKNFTLINKNKFLFVAFFFLFGKFLQAQCNELFISEYVEGSGNNKFIEIYNPTNAAITLTGVYDIQIYYNGSGSAGTTIALNGVIPAYDVFIIENSSESLGVVADQQSSNLNFNGNDAVVLRNTGVNIDVIGQIGFNPGGDWNGLACSQGTANGTLVRNNGIQIGDSNGTDAFNPDLEWTCFNQNEISDLGSHSSSCFLSNEIQLQHPIGASVACGFYNDFGNQIIGSITDEIFRIQNIGTNDLTINNLVFSTGTDFSLVNPPTLPYVIAGGAFLDITIRTTPTSIGVSIDTLTIFNDDSNESSCEVNLQVNGTSSCGTTTQIIAAQDFESAASDTWNYTPVHAPITNYWYVTNSLSSIASAQSNSNFWGITDLERAGHTGQTHEITFDNVNISAYDNVELSFFYYSVNVDSTDDLDYELFYDGVSQGLVDISSNTNAWNQVVVNIPNAVNQVQIIFYADLNAANDQAGLDNFVISSTMVNSTTWDGANWDNGTPDLTTHVIIDADYITGLEGSFSACSLNVNSGNTLTIDNGTYVEVENNVTGDGDIYVDTQGSFVQNDLDADFALNGTATLFKFTDTKLNWYYYTYWSSPVVGETIDGAFPDTNVDRRFLFNAANYFDSDGDDIDDNADDWEVALGTDTMTPGVGYAAASSTLGLYPGPDSADFIGSFNSGDITVPISYNATNVMSWNFIGNPYPCALDFELFYAANSSVIGGAAYFWSQAQEADEANPGNEGQNFNQSDYAIYTAVSGAVTPSFNGSAPDEYIDSAQGFFVAGLITGTVTFDNSMRVTGNNDEFYRTGAAEEKERLWVNLTSDNGAFNQILVAYVDGGTSAFDGLAYDAPRNLASGNSAILYSIIDGESMKFAIQGKDSNSLNESEVVALGFKNTIEEETEFTLSIAQLEGDFMNGNSIYLVDNYLNVYHDLSISDYSFTSESGEFNDRFEIRFASPLSTDEFNLTDDELILVKNENDGIDISTSQNSQITNIRIYDLLGRELQNFNVRNETSVSINTNLMSTSVYITKATLLNGQVLTKKILN